LGTWSIAVADLGRADAVLSCAMEPPHRLWALMRRRRAAHGLQHLLAMLVCQVLDLTPEPLDLDHEEGDQLVTVIGQ
jgi:hypothetical protein